MTVLKYDIISWNICLLSQNLIMLLWPGALKKTFCTSTVYNSLDHWIMFPCRTDSGQNGNTSSWSTSTYIVHTWPFLKPISECLFCYFVLTHTWHCFQLLSSVFAERFPRKWKIIGFSKSPQIKVVLGIYAGGNVDIKLQHLQKLTLKFIPVNAMWRKM